MRASILTVAAGRRVSGLCVFCLALLAFGACAVPNEGTAAPRAESSAETELFTEKRFRGVVKRVLESEGTDGVFVLYDESRACFYRSDPERSRRFFIPASTFKIFNSLVALEEGIIADEKEVRAWDGVERSIAVWNQDHSLATAIRYSAVWLYQEFAREIGPTKMQRYVDSVGYGNGELGDRVDMFWLEGPLAITPQQQVEFIRRLHRSELPFSQRTMDIVQQILVRDQGEGYTLRGKTGWAIRTDPDTGWFVGSLESEGRDWFFALNVDIHDDRRGRPRERLTKQILRRLGLLDDS